MKFTTVGPQEKNLPTPMTYNASLVLNIQWKWEHPNFSLKVWNYYVFICYIFVVAVCAVIKDLRKIALPFVAHIVRHYTLVAIVQQAGPFPVTERHRRQHRSLGKRSLVIPVLSIKLFWQVFIFWFTRHCTVKGAAFTAYLSLQ